jgi:DNA-binding transcriptional ArsR family regulator
VNGRIREISQIDRVVHEPARLKILMFLQAVGEADFLYLQREGEFTQGNLSGHLTKLEEAGYIAIKKTFRGKMPLTVCRLTVQGEKALVEYCRQMWEIVQTQAGAVSASEQEAEQPVVAPGIPGPIRSQ